MHTLIALTQWPSMPAPLSSKGPGELWVWGDYVLVLQDSPEKMAEVMSRMSGTPLESPPMIEYPYAVTAYYRQHKNPHGASSRPILVVGLETMDYAKVAALLNMQGLGGGGGMSNDGPPVLGVFTASGRMNMGSYNGSMDVDAVRKFLFDAVADRLHPAGAPTRLGPIAAIHGNPETGWPAQKKAGCMSALVAVMALAAVCFWLFGG